MTPSLEDVFLDVVDRRGARSGGMSKALAVCRKELRQISRDRRTLLILVFVPAFFLLLYGYALNCDIRHVALGGRGSRRHAGEPRAGLGVRQLRLLRSASADVYAPRGRRAPARSQRRARGAGHSRGFGRDLLDRPRGRRCRCSSTATTPTPRRPSWATPRSILRSAGASADAGGVGTAPPLIAVEPRIWYNPELRSTLFLVPGLIAYIAMITAVVSTALSIVREKESGTMEQVRMAPLDTFSFVVGKTHSRTSSSRSRRRR